MRSAPLRVALVGLGKQAQENYMPAMTDARGVVLTSVCDIDQERSYITGRHTGAAWFTSIEEMIQRSKPDMAIVCLPHVEYLPNVKLLASAGIHVLKEKPFATSMEEARQLHEIIQDAGTQMKVTLVRRHHPIYASFSQISKRLGHIHTIDGRYSMNISRLDEGWRSKRSVAGGGAVLDMGYHAIDLLVWFFGLPSRIAAKTSLKGREDQSYDVEDTAVIQFSYDQTPSRGPIIGSLLISRVFPEKEERIHIVGTRGAVVLKRGSITRLDNKGDVIESMTREGSWMSACVDQIEGFANAIRDSSKVLTPLYFDHFEHMAFVEAVYKSSAENRFVDPHEELPDFLKRTVKSKRRASE